MKRAMTALALLAVCLLARADGSNWRFFAGLGIANGGESISSGTITNVSTGLQTPYDVRTGTGLQYRLGTDYRIAGRLTLQGSIGYSANDPMGNNGSLTFTTIPVEILGFVNLTEALRVGGGVRSTSAEMKGSGVSSGMSVIGTYASTVGTVAEAQYLFPLPNSTPGYQNSRFGVSLRYVTESFTHNSQTYNGNHVELGMALYY